MAKPLNAREHRFVDEYLVDLDPKRAAKAAGYSATVANSKAYQWVSNGKGKPHVLAEIEKRRAKIADKLEVTAERIVAELAKIGYSNMQDFMKSTPEGDPYLDFSQLTRDQAAALAEVTVEDFRDGRSDSREVRRVKFKLHDKRAALVDLGKHLGLFVERHEHTGKDGAPFVPVLNVYEHTDTADDQPRPASQTGNGASHGGH